MAQQQPFDPGLTQQFGGRLRRSINKDGSFNVHRRGTGLRNANLYLWLISMPWVWFVLLLLSAYAIVNLLFACVYYAVGVKHLAGAEIENTQHAFLSCFFFSSHTLTTVGYGNIYPTGIATNSIASLEALLGLLGFAVATGLLYGRVSRPSARIVFSSKMLIAPYQDGQSLQFRIANQRINIMIELEASILLMTVEKGENGAAKRNYTPLTLERPRVYFLPLTWTIVHPIDENSPLKNRTAADLEQMQAEFLVLVKGFDDTFSQTVHARTSYTYEEIVWNARFEPSFIIDEQGDLVLELDRVDQHRLTGPATPALPASQESLPR